MDSARKIEDLSAIDRMEIADIIANKIKPFNYEKLANLLTLTKYLEDCIETVEQLRTDGCSGDEERMRFALSRVTRAKEAIKNLTGD